VIHRSHAEQSRKNFTIQFQTVPTHFLGQFDVLDDRRIASVFHAILPLPFLKLGQGISLYHVHFWPERK
jgi:hypothetical protein